MGVFGGNGSDRKGFSDEYIKYRYVTDGDEDGGDNKTSSGSSGGWGWGILMAIIIIAIIWYL